MSIKGVFGALLFATTMAAAPALAQQPMERAAPVPGPKVRPTLPCCKCLGEEVRLNLNTDGTTPWTVTPGTGPTPTTLSAWTAAAAPASWIQPVSPATPTAAPGLASNTTYHYQVAFAVPDNCTIPYERVQLSGRWASDNQGTLMLDTSALSTCTGQTCFSASSGNPLPFSTAVTPGGHVLKADVTNLSGYSGVLVNATLAARCAERLHR